MCKNWKSNQCLATIEFYFNFNCAGIQTLFPLFQTLCKFRQNSVSNSNVLSKANLNLDLYFWHKSFVLHQNHPDHHWWQRVCKCEGKYSSARVNQLHQLLGMTLHNLSPTCLFLMKYKSAFSERMHHLSSCIYLSGVKILFGFLV